MPATPLYVTLPRNVRGVQVWPMQVSRTKIWLAALDTFVIRLLETEANAMNCPVELAEGPEVVKVRPSESFWQLSSPPQIPAFAWVPSGA